MGQSCIRYVKDTILKAIYNVKQLYKRLELLYSICQRYNFESNLQLQVLSVRGWKRCIRYVKDTILKAIYNYRCNERVACRAVFDMSKIQF